MSQASILLLADDHPSQATTLREHIAAFSLDSRHRVEVFNPRNVNRVRSLRLERYDVVVIHYSLLVISDRYLSPFFRDAIAEFDGLKIQYVQDDYRQVDAISAMVRYLGVDVLFTLVPEREVDHVWGDGRLPNVRTITTLAGYVSDAAVAYPALPLAARPIDVGYRGRQLPYWLGRLGQEKAWIAEEFLERASTTDLRCDIGWREIDRIYGKSWFEWVASCRATLGTESGSSITDFDGSLQRRTEAYMIQHPDADFWTVHREILAPYEGNVLMNVISPRVFEAAALRTALVLFEGEYSGVVEPVRHYIPLAKDFSNFDDVARQLRDERSLAAMVSRTYEEIARSEKYSYRAMAREFDAVVDEMLQPRRRAAPTAPSRIRVARLEGRLNKALRPAEHRGRVIIAGGRKNGLERAAAPVVAARIVGTDLSALRLALDSRGERGMSVDLVRLALMRRAQRGILNAGEPFVIAPELVGKTLTFRSVKPRLGLEPLHESVDDLLASGEVESIAWDHRGFGNVAIHALTKAWWVAFEIGDKSNPGRHRFEALTAHARTHPEAAARALSVLVQPPRIDPATLVVVPPRFHLLLRMLRHADTYAPKALLAASFLVRSRTLRQLALTACADRELRERVGIPAVLADLVKLELLRQGRAGSLAGVPSVGVDVDDGTVTFRTRRDRRPSERVPDGPIDRIVWDHSDVSTEVGASRVRGISFALGPYGVHDFPIVNELMRRRPELVERALRET